MQVSSLSLALLALRESLCAATSLKTTEVTIGTLAQAHQQQLDAPDQTLLNLFVIQVLPECGPADAGAADTAYLRLRCLITPMAGRSSGNGPGPGETDLRLLGAVAAALHAHPGLQISHDGRAVAQLQVVPASLPFEDLSPVWSTQTGVPYRPSLACEIGLLPVPLFATPAAAARVVAVGLRVQPDAHGVTLPGPHPPLSVGLPLASQMAPPGSPAMHATPGSGLRLLWLDEAARPCYAMTLSAGAPDTTVPLVALGPAGTTLALQWELWQPGAPWHDEAGPTDLAVAGDTLPDDCGAVQAMAQPVSVPLHQAGQALLRASATLASASGPLQVRSNALLLSRV